MPASSTSRSAVAWSSASAWLIASAEQAWSPSYTAADSGSPEAATTLRSGVGDVVVAEPVHDLLQVVGAVAGEDEPVVGVQGDVLQLGGQVVADLGQQGVAADPDPVVVAPGG